MATAGSIVVNLIANTGQFTKKMALSKKTIKSLDAAADGFARRMRMVGVAAAAAAVGGVSILTKKSFASIDAVSKLSDRLGVSTEFLSAYGHAAELAGSSQETFAKGIQYMLKNIGEANIGLKSYQDAFSMIGLDYQQLQSMAPEQSFIEIAKRLRDTENASVRVAAAMRIFGRSGSELLNLMQGDLDGVIDRAKELGITFSREQGRMVEDANDAVTEMKAAFGGLGNTIAISISDSVAYASSAITRMLKGKSYELAAFQAGLLKMNANFVGKLQGILHVFRGRSLGIGKLVEPLYKQLEGRKNAILYDALQLEHEMDKLAQEYVDQFNPSRPKPDFSSIDRAGGIDEGKIKAAETFSFKPSAREIDSSLVSVEGLAMQGQRHEYERQQVDLLRDISTNTKKLVNKESLN